MEVRATRLLAVCGTVLVVLALAAPAHAQDITGSISGVVSDPEGAPLPGVSVTLRSGVVPESVVYTQANGVYRFPTLPPSGDYSLTFALEGFQTLVHEGLIVRLSADTQRPVSMAISGVEETVRVVGLTPVVDVKDTGVNNSVTEHYMQSVPSARDPWVMLEHTGAVQVDKQNVGGTSSGVQSGFQAFGTPGADTVWSYDGAVLTHMASGAGSSSMYYDFDAFEEISITTAGNDPSVQTGGIHLNFVTKRGGNRWRGSGRFYFTDGSLQADNVADSDGNLSGKFTEEELFPGYIGNSIDNTRDFGLEIGGPALRDRLYVWGAYGRQEINLFVGSTPDSTQLTNWHGKANWHVGDRAVVNYTFLSAEKTKQGRGARPTRPPATTLRQGGASPGHTVKLQYTVNDNTYLEATGNHFGSGFWLEPEGGRDPQVSLDLATGLWGRSFFFYAVDSPLRNAKLDGNSYIAGANIDHELKYGYSYRDQTADSTAGWAGGAIARFVGGAPVQAWIEQDSAARHTTRHHGVYAGDTISVDRATLNLGLRYDTQTGEALPSTSPANPLTPDIFPEIDSEGFNAGFSWNSISPRLGLTYDVSGSGDGRTILRFNAARYYSQMSTSELTDPKISTLFRGALFRWSDPNDNGAIEADELGDLLFVTSGWDPSDPTADNANVVTKTTPPINDEMILGIEHELQRNFGIGANFVYRRYHNQTWNIRAGEEDDSFWRPVTQQAPGYGPVEVYEPVGPRAVHTVYQQRHDYNTRYVGMELFMSRRFSNRWMANASLSIGNNVQNFTGTRGYTDPTNVSVTDGATVVPLDGLGSTRNFVPYGATWFFKSSGLYEFGSGFSVAGFFQIRQGNLNPQWVLTPVRANGGGQAQAWVESIGETRVPTYWNVDLRAEKTFDLAARSRLHLIVDAFNLTNNAIILDRFSQVNSPNHARITEVLQGRTIRLGVRLVAR